MYTKMVIAAIFRWRGLHTAGPPITLFHFNTDEMLQELNSYLYQLADGKTGFTSSCRAYGQLTMWCEDLLYDVVLFCIFLLFLNFVWAYTPFTLLIWREIHPQNTRAALWFCLPFRWSCALLSSPWFASFPWGKWDPMESLPPGHLA